MKYLLVFALAVFALNCGANSIVEERFIFGESTDLRLNISVKDITDITNDDINALKDSLN